MTNPSPIRYFKISPEINRLAVMMYARVPLTLGHVEDRLRDCRIDVSRETVWFW